MTASTSTSIYQRHRRPPTSPLFSKSKTPLPPPSPLSLPFLFLQIARLVPQMEFILQVTRELQPHRRIATASQPLTSTLLFETSIVALCPYLNSSPRSAPFSLLLRAACHTSDTFRCCRFAFHVEVLTLILQMNDETKELAGIMCVMIVCGWRRQPLPAHMHQRLNYADYLSLKNLCLLIQSDRHISQRDVCSRLHHCSVRRCSKRVNSLRCILRKVLLPLLLLPSLHLSILSPEAFRLHLLPHPPCTRACSDAATLEVRLKLERDFARSIIQPALCSSIRSLAVALHRDVSRAIVEFGHPPLQALAPVTFLRFLPR